MTEREERTISGMTFTRGKLCGKDAVVTVCGEGKVNAAMCAQTMILEFAPDMIINTGVAGGLADGLKIADIVVADCVVQHDMDTSPLGDPKGLVSGINVIYFDADKKASALLSEIARDNGINTVMGTIASGDQFIASKEVKQGIVSEFNAIACEMEGGAVGHVCYVNDVPFGIIRAISDGADDGAHMDYPTFAAAAAKNGIDLTDKFIEMV